MGKGKVGDGGSEGRNEERCFSFGSVSHEEVMRDCPLSRLFPNALVLGVFVFAVD
jgi:hypothetical protein